MSAHSEAAGGLVIGESVMQMLSSLPLDSVGRILGDVFARFIEKEYPIPLDPAERAIASLVLAKAKVVNGSLRKRQEQSKNARRVGAEVSHDNARPSHDNLTIPREERKEREGSPTPLPSKESKEELLNKPNPSSTTTLSKTKKFVEPTVEEVQAYCDERKNGISGKDFVDFYSSKGWMVGKNKMVDWKASVRTWERYRGYSASNRTVGTATRTASVRVADNFRAGTDEQRAETQKVL